MRSHYKMTSLFTSLVGGAVGGAVLAAPFLLYHLLRFPKGSADNLSAFIKKATSSHLVHRGGRPENTLAALRTAKSNGATAVEMDLAFTKDGYPVMLHDSSVDRTSNGMGEITDLDFEQVRKLDFGSKYGSQFVGECIPTLYEVADLCEQLDLTLFLDLKADPTKSVDAVQKLFVERPQLYERVAVISFYPNTLHKLRKVDSKLIAGLVQRTTFFTHCVDGTRREHSFLTAVFSSVLQRLYNWSVQNWLHSFLGLHLLVINKNDILKNRMDVKQWQNRGVSLVAWTVNKKEEKEYFQDVLKIPYLTDTVLPDSEEQST